MTSPRRPPRVWSYVVVALFVTAIATAGYGWRLADEPRRPIGEGELFLEDIETAVEQLEAPDVPLAEGIRSIRNRLEVEAVSLVDSDGVIELSTSETLVGSRLHSPLLVDTISTIHDDGSIASGRFTAVAAAVPRPIEIDGVQMWDAGDVLYQAGHPLDGGGAVLVSYDMSELLARRSAGRGIPQRSIDVFAIAGMIGFAGAGVMMARSRAARTYAVFATEARLLRDQADTLRMHNAELEAARERAERALDLAEEKNRIRSEFVLMINHELRTPLTGVVSGVQLLTDIVEDELGNSILEDVISGARRLEEMLVVARMENRGLFVEPVPTRLDGILCDIEGLSPRWDVTVARDIDGSQEILTDATTLPRLVGSLAGERVHTRGWERHRQMRRQSPLRTDARGRRAPRTGDLSGRGRRRPRDRPRFPAPGVREVREEVIQLRHRARSLHGEDDGRGTRSLDLGHDGPEGDRHGDRGTDRGGPGACLMKRAALVAFAVLLGAACGGADATGEALVRLDEFSVNTAEIVPVGSGELVVRNVGEFGHTLVISDESGRVVVATDLIPPATEVVVAADLDPGRYQFSCRIVVQTPDGAISDHFEQGMVADVEVSPRSG